MSKASIETDMRDYGLSYPISKQTNADRIRNMSDEELAIIIMCPYDGTKEGDCFMEGRNCIQCCKEWLQAEVKEA